MIEKFKKWWFKISHIKCDYCKESVIFYTDTLEYTGDSVGYHNSNGSYVLISDSCMYNCTIEKLK